MQPKTVLMPTGAFLRNAALLRADVYLMRVIWWCHFFSVQLMPKARWVCIIKSIINVSRVSCLVF
jgi:hypothetical protein